MKGYIYIALFYFFKTLIKITPNFLLTYISFLIAGVAYLLDTRRKKIAKANLDFIYKDTISHAEKREIMRYCYKNLAINLIDFMKNLDITEEELKEKIVFSDGFDNINKLAMMGKKLVFITGHFGYWEILPFACNIFLHKKMLVVGRELGVEKLDKFLKESRERYGVNMVSKQKAPKQLLLAMKNDICVGLVVDQNTTTKDGVLVDFFGKESRHTTIASNLARKYDAIIIPTFVRRKDRKYHVNFHDPIFSDPSLEPKDDILRLTELQAKAVEKEVRDDPKEWFWFHRRWKNRYEEIYR